MVDIQSLTAEIRRGKKDRNHRAKIYWSALLHRVTITNSMKNTQLEMWANAQHDGRPTEYRWRPLFNTAKFGWHSLLEYRAVTLPRRDTRWNLLGCPKLANGSQPLFGRSSPYYEDMCRRYWCLIGFSDCLSCEDMARQSCAMVPRWRFFASCIFSEPPAAHFRHAF